MPRLVQQTEFVDGLRDLLVGYPDVDLVALENWNAKVFRADTRRGPPSSRVVFVSEEPLRLAMMYESFGNPADSDTAENAVELVVALENTPAGLVVIDDDTPRDEFRLARGVARVFGVPAMGWGAALTARAMELTPEETRAGRPDSIVERGNHCDHHCDHG